MRFILSVLSGVLLMSALAAHAQQPCSFILSGKIIDSETNEPLELARIVLHTYEPGDVPRGTYTAENGSFEIRELCAGTYSIHISHFSCAQVETDIEITGNLHHDFRLAHSESDTVVEIGAFAAEKNTLQSRELLSTREMLESRGKSLADAFRSVSGYTVLQTGSTIGKPVIHGLHSNRVLVLNNGVRQEGQQWGSEHAPEIDPFIAGQMSVIKGANSVRYGPDAIGGVVIVEARPLRDSSGIGGEVNLTGASNGRQGTASAILEGKFKKLMPLSWRVQGTGKVAGNAHTPDYYLKNTSFREYNFSGALGWKKTLYGADVFYSRFRTKLGIFSGSHIGNLTDLLAAFNSAAPKDSAGFTYEIGNPYQDVVHELAKVRAYLYTGSKGKISVTAARQDNERKEYDVPSSFGGDETGPELRYRIVTHSLDAVWDHDISHQFSGAVGFSGWSQRNTYSGRYFIPAFLSYTGGVFATERLRIRQIQIEAGLRADVKSMAVYVPDFVKNVAVRRDYNWKNLSGTAGILHYAGEHWTLKGFLGTAWRAPQVSELFADGLHHGAASIEVGDSSMDAERAYNASFTVGYDHHREFTFEVSVYTNLIRNFIYMKPVQPPALTIYGAFPVFHYAQTHALLYGADAEATVWLNKHISLWNRSSVVFARNMMADDWIVMMPADRTENGITVETQGTKWFRDLYITISLTAVARQWRVPDSSDYVDPPAGYLLASAEAGFTVKVRDQRLNIGAGVSNALNARYRDYLDRFRYFADAPGRNFTFRLNIPFDSHRAEHEHSVEHPH